MCNEALDEIGPLLGVADPDIRVDAYLDWAAIAQRRATLNEAINQAPADASRRVVRSCIEEALRSIPETQTDRPGTLAATCHAWVGSLLAREGDWRGVDAQLNRGYVLVMEAAEAGELDGVTAGGIAWMMGQGVAEVAIDLGKPERALQGLDTVQSIFGDPPSAWRPHSDLTRLAAEASADQLTPDAIQERAGAIAERFGADTAVRAWWSGATYLLATSHLLAAGQRELARETLDRAAQPVQTGTRGLERNTRYGLRYLYEWGRNSANPGPSLREGMTKVMKGLDGVGLAPEAKRAETWLRKGPPEPPAPPVLMTYLTDERDQGVAEWLRGGD